jgi:DNA-binding transcriptional regulator YhcF (GntR family)
MNAPYLTVDSQLEIPPYQQVVEQIRAAIERGELPPDSPLPTVRQLAGDLGIAPNTVARAYSELQSEGWLVGDGRRGTRVAGHVPQLNRKARGAGARPRSDARGKLGRKQAGGQAAARAFDAKMAPCYS